jgi:hypothetical protein
MLCCDNGISLAFCAKHIAASCQLEFLNEGFVACLALCIDKFGDNLEMTKFLFGALLQLSGLGMIELVKVNILPQNKLKS